MRHSEEETQNINSYKTSGRQVKLSNRFSLPQQDDCKTRKDTQTNVKKIIFELRINSKYDAILLLIQTRCKLKKEVI